MSWISNMHYVLGIPHLLDLLSATWCCMPTPNDTPPIFSHSLILKTLNSFIPSLLYRPTSYQNLLLQPEESFKRTLNKGVLLFHLL
ncbi:unnamed protein product, partial [Vitis vinifera]